MLKYGGSDKVLVVSEAARKRSSGFKLDELDESRINKDKGKN